RTSGVHARHGGEGLGGPARPGGGQRGALLQSRFGQGLQMEAHRVLVQTQPLGELGRGQRLGGGLEDLEHFLAAGGGSQVRIRSGDLHPVWSPCGGTEATSGVSTPRWPILAAPQGEPSGSSRPGSVVAKKSSLSCR